MSTHKINIGLFGFGCVGGGLYSVLEKTSGLKARVKKICVRDRDKKRSLDKEYFTFNKEDLLNDPEINVIVELIDDADAAFEIVQTAIKQGKSVVTANKKMVAEHLEELLDLQNKYKVPFLYEAACCASIPIIRNLEEYYDNDLLQSFSGIMNGTTNFILTELSEKKISYAEALSEAQKNGYAESNPTLDVEGYDSKFKLNILLAHAFGLLVSPDQLFNLGIQRINEFDSKYAKMANNKIKLVANAKKLNSGGIAAYVLPEVIYPHNELFTVDGVYNGIVTESSFADKNTFIGKGAGAYPTASAVLSDISALSYDYKYEYKKKYQEISTFLDQDFYLNIYARYNGKNNVNKEDFSEIHDEYKSNKLKYINGRINYQKLISADWSKDPGISIISLGSEFVSKKDSD
ncbi:MAG: homoserine dehydrogenase [Ignavibacteriaceae bacterium]